MSSAVPNLKADNIMRVDGMVAVITGGGTGIGLMMSRALAANGAAKVYILGRRMDVLEEAAKENPDILIPVQCDVTSKDSIQAAVDRVAKEVGFVNLVIANSGVLGSKAHWNPKASVSELRQTLFTEHSMDDMTYGMHVNTTAAFFTMAAFLELLDAGNKNALKGGFGAPLKAGSDVPSIQSQVIFTSSVAAYSRHPFSSPSYAASKVAIMHLTKQAATALAGHGIRANALAPGLFPSVLASGLTADRDPGTETPENPSFIPARRFGGDEEMGGTILYLASRAGAFNNGLILLNDGGRASVMVSSY
ncbi:short-chain dehydrogenase [Echria macrotheca]|uniref:Short-chain dehydrogenase n=1 Tax=Echria macrotheca TaxID=438768 RepID=A0AAJ0BAE4_9PEZI|nr:short-chain dehydrogenase [Echria macrotheca]